MPVAEVQRRRRIGHDLHRPARRQRPLGLDDVPQRPAVDVLHHDVRQRPVLGLGLAGVVDRHDRRVVQRCGVLRLAAEPQLERGVAGEVGAQDLYRHVPAQAGVAAAVHLGHTAVAESLTELVAVGQKSR